MSLQEGTCDIYQNPDKTNFVFAVLLAVAIVGSYVPQYVKVYKTRTSVGLSPTFIFLVSVAGVAAFSNLILLSFLSLPCCTELTVLECANSQVSLLQVGLQCISTVFLVLFCVVYTEPFTNSEYHGLVRAWKKILFCIAGAIVLLLVAYIAFSPSQVVHLAQLFGLLSTAITFVEYIPQLVETYNLKSSGSLSLLMMLVQTPGGFIWTATLIMKPGSSWSSWLPYLVGACLQGSVLALVVYYDYFHTEKSNPLLQNDNPSYA